MPHEVIMPALGMAQDTGLIVTWRKQAGDKVAVGDVLMEVETDKATMEVEAQADGYLTDVRAGEGDNVPVGNLVAVIADQPGDTAGKPVEPEKAPEPDVNTAPVEGKQVIMPALGMAQDTGLIVAWHKAPGDTVAAGDVLLEVETDKSVMEVEVDHDGYIAELRAEAGENVPVGDVIAVITAEKPQAPVQRRAARISKPEMSETSANQPSPDKTPEPAAQPSAPKTARRRPPAVSGRILASPKARRLAAERGLDLARLRAEGVPQPYHVGDLDRLAALPPLGIASTPAAAPDRIEASVPSACYTEFLEWMANETAALVDGTALLAAFAAASLRAAMPGRDSALIVEAQKAPSRSNVLFADPDYSGLSGVAALPDEAMPTMVVRDLTDSPVTTARFGACGLPALTISNDGNALEIAFEIPAGTLEPEAAIAVVHEMAARLKEPLRHLL